MPVYLFSRPVLFAFEAGPALYLQLMYMLLLLLYVDIISLKSCVQSFIRHRPNDYAAMIDILGVRTRGIIVAFFPNLISFRRVRRLSFIYFWQSVSQDTDH